MRELQNGELVREIVLAPADYRRIYGSGWRGGSSAETASMPAAITWPD